MIGWTNAGLRDIAFRANRLATELVKQGVDRKLVLEAERIESIACKHGFTDPRPHAQRNKKPTSHGAGECTLSDKCDCIGQCKHGRGGHGAGVDHD